MGKWPFEEAIVFTVIAISRQKKIQRRKSGHHQNPCQVFRVGLRHRLLRRAQGEDHVDHHDDGRDKGGDGKEKIFAESFLKQKLLMSRGGGQVVSVLPLYSDDPSSNPAEVYSFSVKFVFEKNENKQKEVWVGPLKKLPITQKLLYI